MTDGKKHSPIGASSMHRWSMCPGSIRLGKTVEKRGSKYAEEGTAAHAVAEQWLRTGGCPNDVDEDTREAVRVYVDALFADSSVPGMNCDVEVSFDLSDIYPGAYGTADAVAWNEFEGLLRVYDYKHGAGVPVEVENNPQLMYYALGALLQSKRGAQDVEMVVVQPRCPHPDGPVRRWRIPAVDLVEFAAELVQYAKATEAPDAPLVPGDWCRFCPASGVCPAVHAKAQEIAKRQFSQAFSYDPAVLADTLHWLPIVETWAKQVREFAYGEAEHGRCPPGFKLVAKRATRKWSGSDDEVVKFLTTRFSLGDDDIYEQSIRSPAQIEKLLTKDARPELANITIKESSGCALAPDSDKREPVRRDAKSEFEKVEA